MNILILGGGGREHALAWAIAQNPKCDQLFCAPGNAGIAQVADCVSLNPEDGDAVVAFCSDESIGFVVVGPEAPLAAGVADTLRSAGILTFGPSAAAAMLETSKAFTKEICDACGADTAAYGHFDNSEDAKKYARQQGAPIVIKADGLAAGKGVVVAMDMETALAAIDDMFGGTFGAAGAEVVIEEFMEGEEASFFVLSDGVNVLPMGTAQDHKRAFDGDKGPNTGGMGAYSPAPVVTAQLHDEIVETIVKPTIAGMASDGCPYSGILYVGLMIKDGKPRVVEYNARFGDPEAQPLLMRMKSDIVPVLQACARGNLQQSSIEWHDKAAVCVAMASGGYPASYEKGFEITGLEDVLAMDDVVVFHAGTSLKDGKIVNSGGRVLGVTGLGSTVAEAIDCAYRAVAKISWNGVHFRKDIGQKALNR